MSKLTACLAAALLCWCTAPALAQDTVELNDGSRIVGTVKTMGGGVLVIESSSVDGGTVKVPMANIKSINTTSEHELHLADGSMRKGTVSGSNGNWTVTNSASGADQVAASDVKSVSPPVVPELRQKGNIDAAARVTDGNTRTKSASANAFYEARTEKTRLTLYAAWNYAQDEDGLSARNTSGGAKYDYFLDERTFLYLNARFENDHFADLNLRSTFGAGAGYQFYDRALDEGDCDFYEEVGLSYFSEDFDTAPDEDTVAARISGRYERDLKENLVFFHFHEAYFGFEDADDVFVDTATGVRIALTGNFYANAQVNYSYDNTPAAGARRSEAEYLIGVGYQLTF